MILNLGYGRLCTLQGTDLFCPLARSANARVWYYPLSHFDDSTNLCLTVRLEKCKNSSQLLAVLDLEIFEPIFKFVHDLSKLQAYAASCSNLVSFLSLF